MSDLGKIRQCLRDRLYTKTSPTASPKKHVPRHILISLLNNVYDIIYRDRIRDNPEVGSIKIFSDTIWIPYECVCYLKLPLSEIYQDANSNYSYVFLDVKVLDAGGKMMDLHQKLKVQMCSIRHSFSLEYEYICNGYFIRP